MAKKLFVVVAVLAVSGVAVLGQAKPSVQGVWRVVEVTTTGPNASTNKNPQPSLYIFTAKHYSIMRVTSDKPRPTVPFRGATAGKLSDAEMIGTFREWQPFQANSGTYELMDATLRVRPVVAKSTAVMASTSSPVYQYKTDGKTLWLTTSVGPTGEKTANPTTLRLVRVE